MRGLRTGTPPACSGQTASVRAELTQTESQGWRKKKGQKQKELLMAQFTRSVASALPFSRSDPRDKVSAGFLAAACWVSSLWRTLPAPHPAWLS